MAYNYVFHLIKQQAYSNRERNSDENINAVCKLHNQNDSYLSQLPKPILDIALKELRYIVHETQIFNDNLHNCIGTYMERYNKKQIFVMELFYPPMFYGGDKQNPTIVSELLFIEQLDERKVIQFRQYHSGYGEQPKYVHFDWHDPNVIDMSIVSYHRYSENRVELTFQPVQVHITPLFRMNYKIDRLIIFRYGLYSKWKTLSR